MKKNKLLLVLATVATLTAGTCALTSCDLTNILPSITTGDVTIELSQTSADLAVGEKISLVATASNGEAVEWSSSNEDVATVRQGRITAVGVGEATVTAKIGEVTATCTVKVSMVEVQIDQKEINVEKGETVQLTATASKTDKPIKWTSSNAEVATVDENGVVTGITEGAATITATYGNSSCKASLDIAVVWANKPADYAELQNGEEALVGTNKDQFVYWNDQGWCGSNVTVDEAWSGNGRTTLSYAGASGACWFGLQMFYKSSENVVGKNYKVSFGLHSEQEGDITVSGTIVHIQKGDNHIEVYTTEQEFNYTGAGAAASLSIQMGVESAGSVISANTVEIYNLLFSEYTPQTLTAPTALTIGADKTITVTDTNGDKAEAYQLAFMQNGEVKYAMTMQNGDKIVDTYMDDGAYDVTVTAVGSGMYLSSAASGTLATYTVSNGGVTYDMQAGGETEANANPGIYYYYTEFAGITDAKFDKGAISLAITNGGNWYSNQLFYKNSSLTAGQTYTLTFKLNSTAAGHIRVNGNEKTLVVGDNEISVAYTEGSAASLSLQFGSYDNNVADITDATVVITDVAWTAGGEVGGGGSGDQTPEVGGFTAGGETDAIANAGKWYYWQEWANNMTDLSVEDGAAKVTLVATGGNWYSYQIFYNNADLTAGKNYKLSMTVNASAACSITVNGIVTELTAGDNTVEITYMENATTASLSVQLGTSAGGMAVPQNTAFAFGNVSWTEVAPPPQEELPAISNGEEAKAINNPGKFIYWNDQGWCGSNVTVNSVSYENGTLALDYTSTGYCDFGMQLFYKNPDLTDGKTYQLTFNLNSTAAGNIRVNGTIVTLAVGDNAVSVTYTEQAGDSSFDIQMGDGGAGTMVSANTLTITNIAWADATATPPAGDEEGGADTPDVPDTPDTPAGESNVTLSFVESYGDHYMFFYATGFDITAANYVAVNGVQQWSENTPAGDQIAFKVYVGDLTLGSYTFEWYKDGAVIATAVYNPA